MIYFNDYKEFDNYIFTHNIDFCIKSRYDICYYHGAKGKNCYHNVNGPARIDLKYGNLTYYLHGECLGENLSNQQFTNELKKIIFM
jgi:hypothetical protein